MASFSRPANRPVVAPLNRPELHADMEFFPATLANGRLRITFFALQHAPGCTPVSDDPPTQRSISRTGYRVHVWCRACRHAKAADLAALVDAAAVTCR
jgi:hypothetical protein